LSDMGAAPLTPVSLTFVVGTGRCGSTLLSRVLREHPDVLCMSDFFGILRLAGASGRSGFPVGDLTGAELWDLLARPFPMLDAMVADGLPTAAARPGAATSARPRWSAIRGRSPTPARAAPPTAASP